jgi:hypothetical protein
MGTMPSAVVEESGTQDVLRAPIEYRFAPPRLIFLRSKNGTAHAEENSLAQEEVVAWNRLNRLMLSSRDFQQALSAATFLHEDMEDARSLADLRRLRCYETNMVVAYARPFSQAHGPVKRLTLDSLAVELNDTQQDLHKHLIERRNRLYAHSDAEFVPFSVEVWATAMPDERPDFEFVMPKFDEACAFGLLETLEIQELCRKLMHATVLSTQSLKEQFADRFRKVRFDL